jgi:glycosyltransferase involved in cell wall biosynthesis
MVVRKKVLWLIKGLNIGGAEKLLAMSLPFLDRDTFDYQVAYLFEDMRDLVPEFERQGIPIVCLNMKNTFDMRVIFKLVRLIQEREVDILHTHLPYSGIVGRIAAIIAGVKAIVSTEHSQIEMYHPITKLGSILTYPLNRANIAVSQAAARSIQKYTRIHPERIHLIYNGINFNDLKKIQTDPQLVKKSFGIERDSLVVGTVANIRPEKGYPYLVEAARLVLDQRPDVRFLFVGREKKPGELIRLEEQAKHLGIRDKIIFTGFRPDALQIIAAFDVFTLSSIWEAFAITILEAMALGKPVVATNVGGCPEAIDEGVNGFLVAPRHPEQLASRILYLLNDEVLRSRMGDEGRNKVINNFSVECVVRKVEQIYLSIVKDEA